MHPLARAVELQYDDGVVQSRSMAAMVVSGSLKIRSHWLKTRLELIRKTPPLLLLRNQGEEHFVAVELVEFGFRAQFPFGGHFTTSCNLRLIDHLPKIISETPIKGWYNGLNPYKLANRSPAPSTQSRNLHARRVGAGDGLRA